MKIIITNIPAFYKINLFNEINKIIPILVIFCAQKSNERNLDFYNAEKQFNSVYLSGGLIQDIVTIKKILNQNDYEELIIGGWDNIYYWSSALLAPRNKNAVIVESSDYESSIGGIKGMVKSIFLRHICKAYCSGTPHERLVKKLGFKGTTIKTLGVGLSNASAICSYSPRLEVKDFLYVGRLAEEKNLSLAIRTFNNIPDKTLTIVGYGPLENELKKIASSNIFFAGAIPNEQLPKIYQNYDVFILPSNSETWGLVVEEALNNGLPVIVSDVVGCREDLVNDSVGLVFDHSSEESLRASIMKISDIELYKKLRKNISQMDSEKRALHQIRMYI